MKKSIFRFAASLLFTLFTASTFAGSVFYGADKGVAIDGYDPVAYFTDGKPHKGSADFTTEWGGITWRFASAAHRDLFNAMPDKYAPQYGGYCAYAMSGGKLADGDGERWRIVDDKLYLNNNWFAHKLWQGDIPGHVTSADKQYPSVKSKLEAGN